MRYSVRAPDGHIYSGTAPDGATDAQIIAHIESSSAFREGKAPVADSGRSTQPKTNTSVLELGKSIIEGLGRQAGLTARDAVTGVLSIPDAVLELTGMHATRDVNALLDEIGLPRPKGSIEKTSNEVASSIASVIGGAGLGSLLSSASSSVARGVGELLSSQLGLQAASAAAAPVAAQAAKDAGLGRVGQSVAGMAGAMIPFANVSGAARRALRGPLESAADGAQRVADFRSAGVSPSPNQVFHTGTMQTIEGLLAHAPGSRPRIVRFGQQQALDMGNSVERAASHLSAAGDEQTAGRDIESGITSPGGFTDRFRKTTNALFGDLDQYVPQDATSDTTHTMEALDRIGKPLPGLEGTSALLHGDRVVAVRKAMRADLGIQTLHVLGPNGEVTASFTSNAKTIPYSSLKALRSQVGSMLDSNELISNIPRGKLKVLYGAITDDMKSVVEKYGGKKGMQAFNRANRYVRAGHKRIDEILQPIMSRNLPERMYTAALSGSRQGGSLIHGVMQSLAPGQQKTVAATVLRMMGQAKPGAQNASGDLFSVGTFLTNWSAMSNQAKQALFSRFGSDYVQNLNRLASVASDIRNSSAVYSNPSGTSNALYLERTIGGAFMALMTGHPGYVVGIGAGMGASNQAAKLILSPTFIRWLSKNSMKPLGSLPAALNELSRDEHR